MEAQEKIESIQINGVEYVRKDSCLNNPKVSTEGLLYCIVRTFSAGVFAGYIKSRNGQEVEILNARRLWYWEGAASLSQLAMEGVSKPDKCKFPCEVYSITVTQAIEILECTKKSFESIKGVKEWKQ